MDKNPLHSTHIQITLTDQDITEIQVTLSIINTEFKEHVRWSLLRIQTKRVSVVHRKDIAYIYLYIYIYIRIYIYIYICAWQNLHDVADSFGTIWKSVSHSYGTYTREFLIVWRNRYNMSMTRSSYGFIRPQSLRLNLFEDDSSAL